MSYLGCDRSITRKVNRKRVVFYSCVSIFRVIRKGKKKKKDSIKKNKKYDKVIICNKKDILSDNSANVSALYKKNVVFGKIV